MVQLLGGGGGCGGGGGSGRRSRRLAPAEDAAGAPPQQRSRTLANRRGSLPSTRFTRRHTRISARRRGSTASIGSGLDFLFEDEEEGEQQQQQQRVRRPSITPGAQRTPSALRAKGRRASLKGQVRRMQRKATKLQLSARRRSLDAGRGRAPAGPPADDAEALYRLYQNAAPDKVQNVPQILAKFAGQRDEMYLVLEHLFPAFAPIERPVG